MGETSEQQPPKRQRPSWHTAFLVPVTLAVVAGAVLWFTGRRGAANLLWVW